MKSICYFLLLTTPLSLTPSLIAATETVVPAAEASYFTHYWTGNESLKNLYFNVSLVTGLDFPNSYTTTKFPGGTGCEIVCIPQKGTKFETEKGVLEQLKITVNLNNSAEVQKVNYTIFTELTFKKSGFFTNTITTTTNSSSGILNTGAINLNERAQFVTITDEPTNAVMIFKQI